MPRPAKISREEVLAAALQIVDQQGLSALSMRRIGDVLGVEAMSLYHHVANKAAVLDGVHEAVLRELELPGATGCWLDDARALALALRAVLIAHPNALPLFATRAAITPGSLRLVEHALALLAEPFPALRDRVAAFQAVVAWVIGQQLVALEAPDAFDYAALSPGAFPLLVEVGQADALVTHDEVFAFGLEALLRGLADRPEGGGG